MTRTTTMRSDRQAAAMRPALGVTLRHLKVLDGLTGVDRALEPFRKCAFAIPGVANGIFVLGTHCCHRLSETTR